MTPARTDELAVAFCQKRLNDFIAAAHARNIAGVVVLSALAEYVAHVWAGQFDAGSDDLEFSQFIAAIEQRVTDLRAKQPVGADAGAGKKDPPPGADAA